MFKYDCPIIDRILTDVTHRLL